MAGNKSLRQADRAKQDEFYTQLVDIENELRHYKEQLSGKTIFCNCDDPYESNFFKYFAMNFNALGLKKLIATCYDDSPIAYSQLSIFPDIEEKLIPNLSRHAYKIEICEVRDYNQDGAVDLSDVEFLLKNKKNALTLLDGNGDFRSSECIELLKEADIVVTNPPFSLFREYVIQLVSYDKKFIIIGNQNAITYQDIFHLLKDDKIWLGYKSGAQEFLVPETFNKDNVYINASGQSLAKFGNICWFTNLDTTKRHEDINLYKQYNSADYPVYDNYPAINVDRVVDIPYDYYDPMGVPITFLDKYNPHQFEIIDAINRYSLFDIFATNEMVREQHSHTCNINGKAKYFRIIIRRKQNEN